VRGRRGPREMIAVYCGGPLGGGNVPGTAG
jgi:hypothetical protein